MAWVLERFLADTRLDRAMNVLQNDSGGEFRGHFAQIRDRYRIKVELMVSGFPGLKG